MSLHDRGLLSAFVVAFDAAPGASYWGLIRGLAEGSSGLSTAQLAGLITGTPQFQVLYPPAAMSGGSSGADKAFSNALISRVLGSAPLS
ncbi:MAG: hypothetical protein EBX30_16370, partial [Betaproteobacteria bacterium]|nr:hypothetical protein [Betaproteobacteria bacterium]